MGFVILDESDGRIKAGFYFQDRKTAMEYVRDNQVAGVVVWPSTEEFHAGTWAELKRAKAKIRNQRMALRQLNDAHVNTVHCLEVALDRARIAESEASRMNVNWEEFFDGEHANIARAAEEAGLLDPLQEDIEEAAERERILG